MSAKSRQAESAFIQTRTVLLICGIFWSSLTLVFDGSIFVPAARQLIATTYPSTKGTILSSEVTSRSASHGTAHGVAVKYNYSVGGQKFIGERYRYETTFQSSDSAWAHSLVAAWVPSRSVDVFYRPADPQDAVLQTGLEGSDLFMFAFMTPFNAVMLFFWRAGWLNLRRMWLKPLAGGVRILVKPGETRARLTAFSPIVVGLAAMALLAVLAIFVVGPACGGFHPAMRTMLVAWSVIIPGAVAAGAWQLRNVLSGKYDLIIDERDASLVLALTNGRKERLRVPLDSITDISVERFQKPMEGITEPGYSYVPILTYREDGLKSAGLAEWDDEEKAKAFVLWLREKLPVKS